MLNKAQSQEIEKYLETKGVFQIDIRLEVLDHIVTGVESSMQNEGLDFSTSFKQEQLKWESELGSYKLARYQIDFKTPKIVLRRYWHVVRDMYFNTLVMTAITVLLSIIVLERHIVPETLINGGIGYFYTAALLLLGMMFLKLMFEDKNTVDKMMFKATIGYFVAWLVVFNPLVSEWYWVRPEQEFMLSFLCIHSFLVCFSFNFIYFYKNHRKKVKLYAL